MGKSKATNIVRMESLRNRTPTGRRSATKVRKLVQYLAFGRGRPAEQKARQQRGQWLDETGRKCSHEDVFQWVIQQGKENMFTHQFILSVRDNPLTPEAFNRAMAAGGSLFSEWRLIQHEDSRHPHAHALAFRQEEVRIKSEAFRAWWLRVRDALEQEQQLAQSQQREQQQTHEQTQQLEQFPRQVTKEQMHQQERGDDLSTALDDNAPANEQEQQHGFGWEL